MAEQIKVLTAEGVKALFDLLSLQDYPSNDVLMAVINAIDNTKMDKEEYVDNKWINANSMYSSMISLSTACTKSVGEYVFIDNNGDIDVQINSCKASNKAPTLEDIKEGFTISTATFNPYTTLPFPILDFTCKTFYPERDDNSGFYTNLITDNGTHFLLSFENYGILIVLSEIEMGGQVLSKGTYFMSAFLDNNQVVAPVSFQINGFNFNEEATVNDIEELNLEINTISKEVDTLENLIASKMDKDDIFIGTKAEYDIAFRAGRIPMGTVVVLTDIS